MPLPLQGGAPRGYPSGSERIPAAPVATRRTGRTDELGAVWLGDRTAVHVVYVAPYSEAHREFARWCDRAGFTLQTVGIGHRVHSDATDSELTHAHGVYTAGGERARVKRWPVAYRVYGPNPIGPADALTFRHSDGRRAPVVERHHPENVVTPVGPGTGQGELSEGAARRLRAARVEASYRAGERARGTIRAHADAPPAPETTVAFDVSELTHTDGKRNELGDLLARTGGRITRVRECYGEPGWAWVNFAFPTGKVTRMKLPFRPTLPVAPAPSAAQRRADELGRLAPPATDEENARAFGLTRAR